MGDVRTCNYSPKSWLARSMERFQSARPNSIELDIKVPVRHSHSPARLARWALERSARPTTFAARWRRATARHRVPHRRSLVVCCVGADTPEYQSFVTRARDFDVCLISYEPGKVDLSDAAADYVLEHVGFKYPNVRLALEQFELLQRYDYVWLPDADLRITSSEVSQLFAIARKFELDVCQPALKQLPDVNGNYSWDITVAQPDLVLRYTNFVEIMCPLFSARALDRLLWTFDLCQSGWGLDALWPKILPNGTFAIIDAINVEHARPVSSEFWALPNGLTPQQELAAILREHCLDHPSPRNFGHVPNRHGESLL